MSFSSEVKEELGKLNNLAHKEEVKYETIGYLISSNSYCINEKNIRYGTESDYNINRFSKLLSNLDINHNIEIVGKSFIITLKSKNIDFVEIKNGKIYIKEKPKKEENIRAIVRGCFLGSGSMNNPDNKYHLEIILSNRENLEYIIETLSKFGINCKSMIRKEKYSIYFKEGEEISKLLAFIGANKSVLKFEEIRVNKEMRGKVNRIVNCKTANINKTINASIEQIEAIKKIQKHNKFNNLNDNLKEIANLRIEYPDMSLSELGKLLKEPLGKSGVNYRLKKIIEIASEIKDGGEN